MRYGRIWIGVIGCQYTYHNEDVNMTHKGITKADQSIYETEHFASLSPRPGHDMIKHGFKIRTIFLKQNIPTLAVSGLGFMNG